MVRNLPVFTAGELADRLLSVEFWKEATQKLTHVPLAKLVPLKEKAFASSLLEEVNRYIEELQNFIEEIEKEFPLPAQAVFRKAVEKHYPAHLDQFLDRMTKRCQSKLKEQLEAHYPLTPPRSKPLPLNPAAFTTFLATSPVALVEFSADWCGPCHTLGPIMNRVVDRYQQRVAIGRVDVDEHQTLAIKYHVASVPTLLFFKKGSSLHRLIGLHRLPAITSILDDLLADGS